MAYIKLEDLVNTMTPEQEIMCAKFYSYFDVGAGLANRKILNVEPIMLFGALGAGEAAELTVYAATKMYLILELNYSAYPVGVATGSEPFLNFYDQANAYIYVCSQIGIAAYWNAAEVQRFVGSDGYINNIYFGRLSAQDIGQIKVIGYRITLGTV